jgi:lauroyl/myristoyl acyltransferase
MSARPAIGAALWAAPAWRGRLRQRMRAALGPETGTSEQVRDYFRRLADLIVFSAVVYRFGIHGAGLENEWEHDSSSDIRYRDALAAGGGALMVCPHLTLHEVMAASLTDRLPITVLVRKSPDPEYEAVKQRWYAALSLEVIYRPSRDDPHGGLAEMTAALRALRKNRVLALTPDLIQRPGTGVPVAPHTKAALLPSFFHRQEGRYRLWAHEPLASDPGLDRDARIADMAQQWASLFESFLREHPEMWQFWLDKRWGRWLDEGGNEG